MTIQRAQRYRRCYGFVLSAMLVITGILLMVQCCSIYFTGEGTFSPEIVAAHFAPIAIPCYLCLMMVILGFVLEVFLPGEKSKQAVEKNYILILEKLHAKTDLSACDESLRSAVAKEQKTRKCHKIVSIFLLAACCGIFFSYALQGENFHQREITDSLIRAMYLLVPCTVIPFGYGIFTAYHSRGSILREIELLKQIGANRSPAAAAVVPSGKGIVIARWAVLSIAVAILVYGYIAGGTADVLTKAINICTECVGLG